jgi:hypothetical protein
MSDFKQRLNQVLYEEIDRRTFLTRVGLLVLVGIGITKFLNLSDLSLGGAKAQKTADAAAPSAPVQDESHHARAMAISSMRV